MITSNRDTFGKGDGDPINHAFFFSFMIHFQGSHRWPSDSINTWTGTRREWLWTCKPKGAYQHQIVPGRVEFDFRGGLLAGTRIAVGMNGPERI